MKNKEELKDRLKEYQTIIAPYKDKIEPEDFFLLGIIQGSLMRDSSKLAEVST